MMHEVVTKSCGHHPLEAREEVGLVCPQEDAAVEGFHLRSADALLDVGEMFPSSPIVAEPLHDALIATFYPEQIGDAQPSISATPPPGQNAAHKRAASFGGGR
jgi:hypothetical protein